MSINWVMLTEDKKTFVPLQGEQTLYKSPSRTSLSLQSFNKSQDDHFSLDCSAGVAALTTRRIVYIPATPTANLESFSAPILNFQDTHISAPWFGPNVWTAVVKPVLGGNIPSNIPALELKMTFKEGGAYDFQNTFDRIKERTQHAVEIAQESGQLTGDGTSSGAGFDGVHLDELPSYEDAGAGIRLMSSVGQRRDEQISEPQHDNNSSITEIRQPAPPPPRYEEVQRESIADALERRVRENEEDGQS